MRIRYDKKIDALYLRLDDAREQVVGIEVLDFKRRVPYGDLQQLKQLVP